MLVEYRDEFTFGQNAQPELWEPTLDGYVARWVAAPRAVAVMPPETYEELLARNLPMQVVYEDVRRKVVIKPKEAPHEAG